MLDWHGQPVRISDSRKQLANFQGNRERGKRGTAVIYSLSHLYFLFTALIWITKCKLFMIFYWQTPLVHWYVKSLPKSQFFSQGAAPLLVLVWKVSVPPRFGWESSPLHCHRTPAAQHRAHFSLAPPHRAPELLFAPLVVIILWMQQECKRTQLVLRLLLSRF